MNVVTRLFSSAGVALRSFAMSWGGGRGAWAWGSRGGSDGGDYTLSDPTSNSILAACLNWEVKKFPVAPPSVERTLRNKTTESLPDHPLLALISNPNPYYGTGIMFGAALRDVAIGGNGYLIKVRSLNKRVVQLWYAPAFMMTPYWEAEDHFIDYYAYTPGGGHRFEIPPTEVIHIRDGIDPANTRLGLGKIDAVARELFTDTEASRWTAAMLRNGGGPNVIISPGDPDIDWPPDVAQSTKQQYITEFTGRNRGAPMVMAAPVKVERVSYAPNEMDLRVIRRLPEERTTAVLGIPAVVVQLGAGLDRSIYNNVSEAKESAIEDCLIPNWMLFAEAINLQLKPDFDSDPKTRFLFDTSKVRELQPDQDRLVDRETKRLLAGGITLDEYRTNTGSEPVKGGHGDVYYIPSNVLPTAPDQIVPDVIEATPPSTQIVPVDPNAQEDQAANDLLAAAGYDLPEIKVLGVLRSIERLRARLQPLTEQEIEAMLAIQKRQAADAVQALWFEMRGPFEDRLHQTLEATFTDAARNALIRAHTRALVGTIDVVGIGLSTEINVPANIRQRMLRDAGLNVKGITDTTFEALNRTIRASQRGGETLQEMTARIEGLKVFGTARATTIARTELAIATNAASLIAYEASGIVRRVRCHDGTHFDEPCAGMAGRIFTIDAARSVPTLAHPNCTRRWEPIVERRDQTATSNGHIGEKELVGV